MQQGRRAERASEREATQAPLCQGVQLVIKGREELLGGAARSQVGVGLRDSGTAAPVGSPT